MRRRQTHGLRDALRRLQRRVREGRLKERDKIVESVGRLKERFPQGAKFVDIQVSKESETSVSWTWDRSGLRDAFARDGAYLLKSNYTNWSVEEFWENYIQLTAVESAFRALKSDLLVRPIWHQLSGRVEAHIMICVLAYALWKTLEHLAKKAGLMTLIRKPDPKRPGTSPQPRPMSPATILRELSQVQIGDILLETIDHRQLALRRVARPMPEQARILQALDLTLPERLSPDRLL